MKYLGEGGRTGMALCVLHLDITHPDILDYVNVDRGNFRGSKDASTSPENSGLIQKLESKKQSYEELQKEIFGSTK